MIRDIELPVINDEPLVTREDVAFAQRGARILGQIQYDASSSLDAFLSNSPYIHAMFIGVAAEVRVQRFEGFPSMHELASLIRRYSDQFLVVPIDPRTETYSFFNLERVSEIVSVHEHIFRERSVQDLTEWLTRYPSEWSVEQQYADDRMSRQVSLRRGLFSGYPVESAQRYYDFVRAFNHFESHIDPSELRRFLQERDSDTRGLPRRRVNGNYPIRIGAYAQYADYILNGFSRTASHRDEMALTLQPYIQILPEGGVDLMLDAHRVDSTYLNYIGFSPDADRHALVRAHMLSLESDIHEILK